ncbi:MAG TPA: carboxypeptidase regulatory-like domain-containing protein [Candidatus Cybelea sp.]|nr:carboxypeptidase regulatory-like domain-containing protein [Candidatus Cybelea sp.]
MSHLRNVFVLLFILSSPVLAQQITGNIRGTVSDSSGGVVVGASVSAVQLETGLTRTATTGRDGSFAFLELPVGQYRLSVDAPHFESYVQQGISLDVNDTAVVPIRLAVASTTQTVHVEADARLIQPDVTSMGDVVGERDLLDLPLDGRNFYQLGLLQPGVVPLTPGLLEAGGVLRQNQGYAVDGQRPESNNFLIDGADNVNAVDSGFVLKPPIDAIAEFRILTHNADAEFGHNLGSTTNIITRGGTNAFHGAVWEFLRNDAMDASDYFAQAVQPLKQNQFGATTGGPIVKNKTFFFGYYEGFRNRQGETVPATVPTAPERQGDFSATCTAGFTGGICNNPAQQLYSFLTGQPEPVPNNTLTSINPIAQNILPFFPLPNQGASNPNGFVATQSLSLDNNEFGLRLDHYLDSADELSFRYMYSSGPTVDPLSSVGANVPGFPVGLYDRAQNFVAQETRTFSSSLVGVARFSFLRNQFLLDEHIDHEPPSALGFEYEPTLAAAAGPPFIQVAGYASVGDPITGPRNTYQNSFDVSGSLSWVRAKHELKFGGGFERDQINAVFGIASNGFFVFSTFPYSDAFASFLSGNPVFFLQGGGNPDRHLRGAALNFYAQDTYKINARLTANLGLRYELPSPDTETNNLQNLWVPGVQSKVMPSAPPGLLYPGDPGVPAGLIPTEKTAFGPRVGLAYDPTGSGKWLISSAYGIYYEPYYTGEGGPLQDPVSAPPYLQTPQVNFPVNLANPFNGANPFGPVFSEPMTLLVISNKLRLPYTQDWNLSVQRSFGANWLLEVAYVGTVGVKLPRFIEGDPAVYIPGVDANGNPLSTESNVNQRRLYSGCTLTQPNTCLYGSVGEIASVANSNYNALESSLRKRFGHGLSFLASYTYSKTIDDVSSFNITGSASQPLAGENDLAQDPFDLAAERGRSMFDARHRFVLSYEWNLPFWRQPSSWYEHVLGNWQLNGIFTASTGTPFTVFDSNDVALEGSAPEITGFSSERPNLVSDPFQPGPVAANPNCVAPTQTRVAAHWFNPCAFVEASTGTFGDEGRNAVEGPGYSDWDFSAVKNISLTERDRLQFRAEFFNFLNHTNLRLPETDIQSPTIGVIQQDVSPRVVQVALKLLF